MMMSYALSRSSGGASEARHQFQVVVGLRLLCCPSESSYARWRRVSEGATEAKRNGMIAGKSPDECCVGKCPIDKSSVASRRRDPLPARRGPYPSNAQHPIRAFRTRSIGRWGVNAVSRDGGRPCGIAWGVQTTAKAGSATHGGIPPYPPCTAGGQ